MWIWHAFQWCIRPQWSRQHSHMQNISSYWVNTHCQYHLMLTQIAPSLWASVWTWWTLNLLFVLSVHRHNIMCWLILFFCWPNLLSTTGVWWTSQLMGQPTVNMIVKQLSSYAYALWISVMIVLFSFLYATSIVMLNHFPCMLYNIMDQMSRLWHMGTNKGVFILYTMHHLSLMYWIVVACSYLCWSQYECMSYHKCWSDLSVCLERAGLMIFIIL